MALGFSLCANSYEFNQQHITVLRISGAGAHRARRHKNMTSQRQPNNQLGRIGITMLVFGITIVRLGLYFDASMPVEVHGVFGWILSVFFACGAAIIAMIGWTTFRFITAYAVLIAGFPRVADWLALGESPDGREFEFAWIRDVAVLLLQPALFALTGLIFVMMTADFNAFFTIPELRAVVTFTAFGLADAVSDIINRRLYGGG